MKTLSKVKIIDCWLDHKYDLKILAILAMYIFAVGGIVFLGYNVSKKNEIKQEREIIKKAYEQFKKEQQKQDSIVKYHNAQNIK